MDAALSPKKENKDDSKKDERKQRDRKLFLGAYLRKFLDSSDFYKNELVIQRVGRLFDLAEPEKEMTIERYTGRPKTTLETLSISKNI